MNLMGMVGLIEGNSESGKLFNFFANGEVSSRRIISLLRLSTLMFNRIIISPWNWRAVENSGVTEEEWKMKSYLKVVHLEFNIPPRIKGSLGENYSVCGHHQVQCVEIGLEGMIGSVTWKVERRYCPTRFYSFFHRLTEGQSSNWPCCGWIFDYLRKPFPLNQPQKRLFGGHTLRLMWDIRSTSFESGDLFLSILVLPLWEQATTELLSSSRVDSPTEWTRRGRNGCAGDSLKIHLPFQDMLW